MPVRIYTGWQMHHPSSNDDTGQQNTVYTLTGLHGRLPLSSWANCCLSVICCQRENLKKLILLIDTSSCASTPCKDKLICQTAFNFVLLSLWGPRPNTNTLSRALYYKPNQYHNNGVLTLKIPIVVVTTSNKQQDVLTVQVFVSRSSLCNMNKNTHTDTLIYTFSVFLIRQQLGDDPKHPLVNCFKMTLCCCTKRIIVSRRWWKFTWTLILGNPD